MPTEIQCWQYPKPLCTLKCLALALTCEKARPAGAKYFRIFTTRHTTAAPAGSVGGVLEAGWDWEGMHGQAGDQVLLESEGLCTGTGKCRWSADGAERLRLKLEQELEMMLWPAPARSWLVFGLLTALVYFMLN